jgi:large repetitive protein
MNEASPITQAYEWVLATSYNGIHDVVMTHESGGAVNLDAIRVPGLPTSLTITADSPDPSEFNQPVVVSVMLRDVYNAPVPNAGVEMSGADINCLITTDSNGNGNCTVIFSTVGVKVITAYYQGDAKYYGTSISEDHTVTLVNTVTTILSDQPDPSLRDDPVVVSVRVTGGINTPTGSVAIDGGDGVGCTIQLNNGQETVH